MAAEETIPPHSSGTDDGMREFDEKTLEMPWLRRRCHGQAVGLCLLVTTCTTCARECKSGMCVGRLYNVALLLCVNMDLPREAEADGKDFPFGWWLDQNGASPERAVQRTDLVICGIPFSLRLRLWRAVRGKILRVQRCGNGSVRIPGVR